MLQLPKLFRTLAFKTGLIRYYWQFRHLLDGSYRDPPSNLVASDPHRTRLAEIIETLSARSVLEIGCADGANLSVLASRMPSCALSAVDLNAHALHLAARRVNEIGGTLGETHVATAEHLPLGDYSVDVALSDAVFMYLTPAAVSRAIKEMHRVSQHAMIIHSFADDGLLRSELREGNWIHPIARMLTEDVPHALLRREKSPLRSGQWGNYGTIYEVTW